MMYIDHFEKFVHMPVRRQPAPTPIVPRERVEPPPRVKAQPNPVPQFMLAASFGWPAQPTTLRALVEVVAKVSGVRVSDILGRSHVADHAKGRHIAAWLGRRFTSSSTTVIATHLRRKDHSTVLYGIARVDLAIQEGPIRSPAADAAEAWASVLWATPWPALNNRDPMRLPK